MGGIGSPLELASRAGGSGWAVPTPGQENNRADRAGPDLNRAAISLTQLGPYIGLAGQRASPALCEKKNLKLFYSINYFHSLLFVSFQPFQVYKDFFLANNATLPCISIFFAPYVHMICLPYY